MGNELTITYLYQGEPLTIVELMKFSVVGKGCLISRLGMGWDVDDALTKEVRPKGVDAGFSKGDLDVDIAKKQARDKALFEEHAGFAQCSRRTNAK